MAKPRRRLNHCATRWAQFSMSEPWPVKRSAAKPSASDTGPVTAANAMQARPNSSATTVVMRRAPCRSTSLPIRGSANAAASVAMP